MRKIVLISFLTIDGVMQAPGGPEEDPSAEFKFGGWQAPYEDPVFDEVIQKELDIPASYLLGRKTFEIWEGFWPKHTDIWPGITTGMKYVLSNTVNETEWQNTRFLKNIDEIKKLKEADGSDLQVWGSSKLVQLLMQHDLIDEMLLMTYPLVLGQGKKLFADGAAPAAFTLTQSLTGSSGVMIARYIRAGEVKTGTVS